MLSVKIENSGRTAILRCSGRIVAGEEAWTLFNAAISVENKRVVVLDFTEVAAADARGLGVMLFLKQWADGAGVKLQVVPSKPVLELLELTGLHTQFEIGSGESAQPIAGFLVESCEQRRIAMRAED
jgi:anti-anti-sigma regulatory factor